MNDYIQIYELNNAINEIKIIGPNSIIISLIEEIIGCEIILKQAEVKINKDDLLYQEIIIKLFTMLENLLSNNININARDIVNLIQSIKDNRDEELMKIYLSKELIVMLNNGKPVYPKSINQQLYINSLNHNDIIFAVGPAGTGKTYLAVLYAVSQLRKNQTKKIILVRPVVEAGEKLGFLPGDLKEKIDPYLIPLYDALNDCFGKENTTKMIEKGIIEVAPLAYMRGRTLDNAIIILDEAQNATALQTKMFLTRLGFNSKMIITGDVTQIDLPYKQSGLVEAINLLNNINGIGIINFDKHDVMRHPLVYKIVKQYEENENGNKYL
jgi:phosphate starvation-inducible PhoH-like protein